MERALPSMLGAASIVLLALVVSFAGGCRGEEAPVSSADEEVTVQDTTEQGTEQPAEDPVASVGEPVTVGDKQWTVTDAQRLDELVSRMGVEPGNFVYVDLTFSNYSNQDVTLATPLITLLDSEGTEFEPDIERNFRHVEPEKNLFIDQVGPGVTKDARVIFSVTPDASGFKLQVGEARFASSETAYIDLGF